MGITNTEWNDCCTSGFKAQMIGNTTGPHAVIQAMDYNVRKVESSAAKCPSSSLHGLSYVVFGHHNYEWFTGRTGSDVNSAQTRSVLHSQPPKGRVFLLFGKHLCLRGKRDTPELFQAELRCQVNTGQSVLFFVKRTFLQYGTNSFGK